MGTGRFSGKPPADLADEQPRIQSDILGARVFVDVVVPRTEIAGRMRLLSRNEMNEARVSTLHALSKMGIDTKTPSHIFVEEWNAEFNARILSLAVRDPQDAQKQLGDIEEWRDCDDDQISALFVQYNDLAYKIDPLGNPSELAKDELEAMVSAAKKKHADILISYGSRKLALFAITSVEQPAS